MQVILLWKERLIFTAFYRMEYVKRYINIIVYGSCTGHEVYYYWWLLYVVTSRITAGEYLDRGDEVVVRLMRSCVSGHVVRASFWVFQPFVSDRGPRRPGKTLYREVDREATTTPCRPRSTGFAFTVWWFFYVFKRRFQDMLNTGRILSGNLMHGFRE